MTRSEEMLAAQAHTLDALFNHLARRALSAELYGSPRHLPEDGTKRAQSQCRATLETLSVIKNPPMVGYIRQANIAGGHQQVNNGPGETYHVRGKCETRITQLLEKMDGKRLDFGAKGRPYCQPEYSLS